jgi:hypothetical protein
VTGGNPRLLGILASLGWDKERLLEQLVEQRIAEVVEKLGADRVRSPVEDPDSDPEAAEALEDMNLMIRLGAKL